MTYPLDPYWNPSIRSSNEPDTMVADLSVSITAVINLLPPFTSLSVTGSCFVDEPSTQFYSGNHFIGNMPYEDNNKTSSCVLSRQYIRFGSDGIPERSELQEECEEYNDTNISSNMVCF